MNLGLLLADAESWIPVGWCIILGYCWLMQNSRFLLADPESWIPVGWCRILDSCWLMQNSRFLLADAESWIPIGWCINLDSCWLMLNSRCSLLDTCWPMQNPGSCWLMQNPGFLLADAESWIPVGWWIILDSCWLMHYPGFLLADAESLTHIGWYRIAVNRKQKSYWQFNSTMRRWMWISKKFIWSWFNSTSRYRKWWAGSITQIPCRGFTWYSTNRDSKRSWI